MRLLSIFLPAFVAILTGLIPSSWASEKEVMLGFIMKNQLNLLKTLLLKQICRHLNTRCQIEGGACFEG